MLCFIIDTKIDTGGTRLAPVRVVHLPAAPSHPTTHSLQPELSIIFVAMANGFLLSLR